MKHIAATSFILFFIAQSVYAQFKLPPNFYYQKMTNGFDVLVVADSTQPTITVETCVKAGAFTESPSMDGVARLYEHILFDKGLSRSQTAFQKQLKEVSTRYGSASTKEHLRFSLETDSTHLQKALELMHSRLCCPVFTQEALENEKSVVATELAEKNTKPEYRIETHMLPRLWGEQVSRKNVFGNPDTMAQATIEDLEAFREKYFYPNNSLIIVSGKVDHHKIFNQVADIFLDWQLSEFDPHGRWLMPELRPLLYSHQFIVEDDTLTKPTFYFVWQGPDTRRDISATHGATVFCYLVNQTNSTLQQALVGSGLAYHVNITYTAQRYVGTFALKMTTQPAQIKKAYQVLLEQIALWDSDDYFTDTQLQAAKDLIALQYDGGEAEVLNNLDTIAHWWASANLDYHSTFVEKTTEVDRDEIKRTVVTYLKDRPYIAGLMISQQDREALRVDTFFTDTYAPIETYTFAYKRNAPEFADSSAIDMLRSLRQWMYINPETHIMINGNADKSELLRVKDKEIRTFIDSAMTFRLYPKPLLPQRNLRLDILRSMKVVKYLNEAGIAIERLTGSGKLLTSENKQEAAKNRRAVVKLLY